MKKAILALFLLLACSTRAQVTYALQTPVLTGGTNRILATSSNYYAATTNLQINVGRQSVVTVELGGRQAVASGQGNPEVITFWFDRTIDRVGWAYYTNVNLLMNGTTGVTNLFDIFVGGAGWLRIAAVSTTNIVAATNLFAQYPIKTGL